MTGTFNDAPGLRDLILKHGGALEIRMAEPREVRFAGRLGCHARADIGRWLAKAGVGWLPDLLPNDQRHIVILYLHDSPAGKAFDVARHVRFVDAETSRAVVA